MTQPTTTSKSHPTKKSKWEHPPPTPLSNPHESCFPKNRTHEGYMNYHDRKTSLTSYYFVLSNNFLLAAEDKESTKLSIVIPVEGKTISIDESKESGGCGKKFVIGGKKKTFHFETPSRESTIEWTEVIRKACTLKVHDIYRFAYEIGSGSMGTTVIAAEHRSTRKRVAIKVINKKKIKNRTRLSHEITIMKQLRHQPCIVELYDIYESKKHLYLVMELCEGGDLLSNVANEAQLEDITCHVMHQIARAVNYMHKKGIVHRDLKPENILCCKKTSVERIKVADFGISKHMDNVDGHDVPSFSTPVGTLTYTAPELLNGNLYGKEVDYWALGVIMHIMLCGYSPWAHCTNEIETRRAIIDHEIELKDEDWMHVSESVKDLVLRLLHRDPQQRATNDEILKITWEENTNHSSWKNARSNLRKTIRGDRARQCSTGMVEANMHLMKRVYARHKYNKTKNKKHKKKTSSTSISRRSNNDEDSKEERYLSPPPKNHQRNKPSSKYKHKKRNNSNNYHSSPKSISQSSTSSATDEESDNFPSANNNKIIKKPRRRRKKSNHSSEPLHAKKFTNYSNHEYRRRSRDDSELCNARLNLAARSIERYIEKLNKKKNKKGDDNSDSDDELGFPHVKGMGYSLFDL